LIISTYSALIYDTDTVCQSPSFLSQFLEELLELLHFHLLFLLHFSDDEEEEESRGFFFIGTFQGFSSLELLIEIHFGLK